MEYSLRAQCTYLVIFGSKLVQALLNDMIAIQILDKHYNMKAQSKNDRMYLSIVFEVSLALSCK